SHNLSSNTFELEFIDTFFPLSLRNYKVVTNEESINLKVKIIEFDEKTSAVGANKVGHTSEAFIFEKSSSLYLENDFMPMDFNKAGFIERVHVKDRNVTEKVEMSFMVYHSKPTESGAYLFKPTAQVTKLFTSATPQLHLVKGKVSSTLMVN